jgi:hypothetical protein
MVALEAHDRLARLPAQEAIDVQRPIGGLRESVLDRFDLRVRRGGLA